MQNKTINKWKITNVSPEEIVPAEMNANEMDDKTFERLCKNIGMSGLSSTITCYKRKEDNKYVIISGHHRYRAAVLNGIKTIPVLYADEEDLTKDEIIAIQLSHNSLHGEDDKNILKKLFEEIKSIDFKEFSNIEIDEIGKIDVFSPSIVPIQETYTVSIVLFKPHLDLLDEITRCVNEALDKSDVVILENQNNAEEEYMKLTAEIAKKFEIKSPNIAFSKILELAKAQLEVLDGNMKRSDSNKPEVF